MTTTHVRNQLIVLTPEGEELRSAITSYQMLEFEALTWIKEHNAIVMLVEVEVGTCKHCGEIIKENAGWVVHKWKHQRTGAYLCYMKFTRAAPEEEE